MFAGVTAFEPATPGSRVQWITKTNKNRYLLFYVPEHSKIIARVAKETLAPLGLFQKGSSRTWTDDHGWWIVVIEFQPSGFGKGSYLNVGAMWLWHEKDNATAAMPVRKWPREHSNARAGPPIRVTRFSLLVEHQCSQLDAFAGQRAGGRGWIHERRMWYEACTPVVG